MKISQQNLEFLTWIGGRQLQRYGRIVHSDMNCFSWEAATKSGQHTGFNAGSLCREQMLAEMAFDVVSQAHFQEAEELLARRASLQGAIAHESSDFPPAFISKLVRVESYVAMINVRCCQALNETLDVSVS